MPPYAEKEAMRKLSDNVNKEVASIRNKKHAPIKDNLHANLKHEE